MKRFLSVILSIAMLITSVAIPFSAFAEEIFELGVKTFCKQDFADELLNELNEFRKGDEAWYWNNTNTQKIYPNIVQDMKWDSRLEEAAMQRAVECAFYFDHKRPDGSSFNSVNGYSMAENIARCSPSEAFELFKETDEKYAGQGHRRNMLNGMYNCVGMAYVQIEDNYGVFVQEFGRLEADNTPSNFVGNKDFSVILSEKYLEKGFGTFVRAYYDGKMINRVSIYGDNTFSDNFTTADYDPETDTFTEGFSTAEINIEYGTSKELKIVPEVNRTPVNKFPSSYYYKCYLEEGQDVVELNNNVLEGKKLGTTKLYARLKLGDTNYIRNFELTINVVPATINNKNTTFDLEYDKIQYSTDIPLSEYNPKVSNVVYHGEKGDVPLVEGVDYYVDYDVSFSLTGKEEYEVDYLFVRVYGLGNYSNKDYVVRHAEVYCNHNFVEATRPIADKNNCTETYKKCTVCGIEKVLETNHEHMFKYIPIPYDEIKNYIRDMYNADTTAQSEYTFEEYYDNYMNSIPYSEYELWIYECENCGYIPVEENGLPKLYCNKLKHTFEFAGNNDGVEATCATDGRTESGLKTCTTCGYQVEVKSEVIPATNKHTLNNTSNPTICRVMLTPNTCDENGTIQFSKYYGGKWTDYNSEDFTCSVCGKCFNVELPSLEKTGHNIKTTTSYNGTLKIEYCDNKTNAITLTGKQLKAIYNDKNFFQFLFNSNNPVTISITFNNHGEDVDEIVSNLWCVDFDATTGTQIKSYKLNNGKICGSGGQEIINPQKNISYVTNDNYTTLTTDCNYIRGIYKYFDPTYYFDENSSITVTYENCDYEKKTELDHYYELTNTVESTCKVAGYEEYTCIHCGDSYTEPLGLAEHTLVNGNDRIEPTCEKDGYTGSGVCTVCGKTIAKGDVIPALGHKYTSVIVPPTCSEQGYTLYTCERCGDTYKADYVEATGKHNVVIDKAVEATCTTEGLTEGSHCADCGKVIVEQKVIDKTGHTSATLEAVAPTCTTNGLTEGLYCSVCGEILKAQEKINKTSHNAEKVNAKKATSTEDGYTGDTVCSECKTVIARGSVIPKASNIKLSRTSITYTGSVQRPSVTITDEKGNSLAYKKDFTVRYSNWNSKNVGEYTVTVDLIGNYSGTYTYSYCINPKPTTLSSVSGISNGFTVKWNKQNNQTTGYQIQYSTRSDFKNAATVYGGNANTTSKSITGRAENKRYYIRVRTYKNIGGKYFYSPWSASKSVVTLTANPKPTTLVSLTARSKGFTVKWNKQANQTTGYQIQYSTRSDFKNAATVYGGNANTTSKTITGRAGKTRYYVRVRTYRNVGGKYYYSSWSPSKSVVTLK